MQVGRKFNGPTAKSVKNAQNYHILVQLNQFFQYKTSALEKLWTALIPSIQTTLLNSTEMTTSVPGFVSSLFDIESQKIMIT